jgi:alpha-ketoglutarate-dependent taurine dioxygenase
VVEPAVDDVSLTEWAASNLEFINKSLLRNGGILLRGFRVNSTAKFSEFLDSINIQRMHYMEGATPRVELGNQVYTSTSFPPEQYIALHNELCYVTTWPMRILFFCLKAADVGGETPIGDVRRVLQRISPGLRERFTEKGWALLRNFGGGFGLPWQTSYRIDSKAELEDYFRRARIEFEWKGGGRLRTWQRRPAVATHPQTHEMVWFNHIAFWHVSSLRPELKEMFLSEFGEDNLPYNTYYGDGARIEDSEAEELREAYSAETVAFPWQEGDVLLLDNMLVAHGRFPYQGSRNVLVAMGNAYSRPDS